MTLVLHVSCTLAGWGGVGEQRFPKSPRFGLRLDQQLIFGREQRFAGNFALFGTLCALCNVNLPLSLPVEGEKNGCRYEDEGPQYGCNRDFNTPHLG